MHILFSVAKINFDFGSIILLIEQFEFVYSILSENSWSSVINTSFESIQNSRFTKWNDSVNGQKRYAYRLKQKAIKAIRVK